MPANEDSLLDRAAHGDADAFAQLISPYRAELVRFACVQLGHLGEDAVQEAMVNAYRALTGGARPENLRAWLFTIVRNCAVNIHRAQRPVTQLPASSASESPDTLALLEQRERIGGLMSAISALPDRQRQVLVGHTFEGRSYQELAARHGTTVSAVKTLLHRARRGLCASNWVHAPLAPWVFVARWADRLPRHGKLAARTGIKDLLLSSPAQMLGAATIASTVLLAVPGTRPGPAIATPVPRHDSARGHPPHGGRNSVSPATARREANRTIASCERGKRSFPGRSPAALRYAAKHLPTIAHEYTDCEFVIERALRRSFAPRRHPHSRRR